MRLTEPVVIGGIIILTLLAVAVMSYVAVRVYSWVVLRRLRSG